MCENLPKISKKIDKNHRKWCKNMVNIGKRNHKCSMMNIYYVMFISLTLNVKRYEL